MSQKLSKRGSLTPAFLARAQIDQFGALSYMLMAAFGVTLAQIMETVSKMLEQKNLNVVVMCLTAGVQIRAHVVFVGRDFENMRFEYPALIIEGERPQADIFNFGALHACGHLLAHLTDHKLGKSILAKAGSCITGENTTLNEAGQINKELFESWTPTDKSFYATWAPAVNAASRNVIINVCDAVLVRSTAFGAAVTASMSGGASSASSAGGARGPVQPPPAKQP